MDEKPFTINQEIFERDMMTAYDNIKNPTIDDQTEYMNAIRGGDCHLCGVPWIAKMFDKKIGYYHYFKPACKCLEGKKEASSFIKHEQKFNCEIPDRYQEKNMKNFTVEGKSKNVVKVKDEIIKYLLEGRYKNKGLFIRGQVGVGKTHLAIGALKYITHQMHAPGLFVHCTDLVTNMIEKWNYAYYLLAHKVIVLDDIDKIPISSKDGRWSMNTFFGIIDKITANNRVVIVTTNIESLENLRGIISEAIVSRLVGACEEVIINGDDQRLK